MTTVHEAFLRGKKALDHLSCPELEARILLCASLSLRTEDFFIYPGRQLTSRQNHEFLRLIRKRRRGYPLAYLTGEKEFWSLSFLVKPGVLIPRPETELLVEKTVELSVNSTETIVDIGTGCGNIAVSIAKEISHSSVLGTDISRRALKVARTNSVRNGQTRIKFLHGNMFTPLERKSMAFSCDFIVSNPPYLSAKDWQSCPAEMTAHEPKRALVSGKTGMEFIGMLIERAVRFLKPGGYLLFEIGFGQVEGVKSLFDKNWESIDVFHDLAGIPRVFAARKEKSREV